MYKINPIVDVMNMSAIDKQAAYAVLQSGCDSIYKDMNAEELKDAKVKVQKSLKQARDALGLGKKRYGGRTLLKCLRDEAGPIINISKEMREHLVSLYDNLASIEDYLKSADLNLQNKMSAKFLAIIEDDFKEAFKPTYFDQEKKSLIGAGGVVFSEWVALQAIEEK